MNRVSIEKLDVPVVEEVDVCVVGGSCTGVFAAIRAAQSGARTALVERGNRFGGTATLSQVLYWHSLHDISYEKQIVFGLTHEVIERLKRRDAVEITERDPSHYARLNTEELAIELDEMVKENALFPFLHTTFVLPVMEDGRVTAIITAGKNGLEAIRAKAFVDATGDGDLCAAAGVPMWSNAVLQPPTMCAKFSGWPACGMHTLGEMIRAAKETYHLPEGFVWGSHTPGSATFLLAATKIPDADLSGGRALTGAEIEGRRQLRAIQDIIAANGYPRPVLEALPSLIGIRDTRHITALHRLTEEELLSGTAFPDGVARGTYRVDIHSQEPPGTRFRYLDGREVFLRPGCAPEESYWRDPASPPPPFYSLPLRSMIPVNATNLIAAGRMIDADAGAFGAVRVMVTMNQCGEAAGYTAALCADRSETMETVSNQVIGQVKKWNAWS